MRDFCKCLKSCSIMSYLLIFVFVMPLAEANMAVLQRGYTPDVAGANLNETILTPSNISSATFGRLFSLPVEGAIYAQPLYVPNLNINGSIHNVVFVATMNNYVYAFDADTPGAPLWSNNYSSFVPSASAVPITYFAGSNSYDISGSVGIESTPVIDQISNTIYFVTNTLENSNVVFRLHAVDITSGAEKFGGPVVIDGSVTVNGNIINFTSSVQNQRTSLTLSNGQVIVAFASHEDNFLYYGWAMSYNASTLAMTGIFNGAPANYGAGIWQSGRPPAVDSAGYVYLYTGNGFSVNNQVTADGVTNFAESVVKLDPVKLNVVDYFTPGNYQTLDQQDLDLSSSGPTLIPGSNVLIGGGKNGILYLLNSQNLGQMTSNDTGALQSVVTNGSIRGGTIAWNRSSVAGDTLIYNWNAFYMLQVFGYNAKTNTINLLPITPDNGGPLFPGGLLALSANGDQEGVIWANINSQYDASVPPGELRAINATTLTQLWSSTTFPGRDDYGLFTKYVPPLVVNGQVYMATQSNQLVVYGLLPTSGATTVTAWPPRKAAMGGIENFLVSAWSASGVEVTAAWSVTGLPTGVSGEFQVDIHGRNLLHLTMDGTTPQGSYLLSITATVQGQQTTQTVLLDVVNANPTTAVSAVADAQYGTNVSEMAIDQNVFTFWESLYSSPASPYPHSITLNLGSIQPVAGLFYLPRQDGCVDGTALQYEIYLSQDNVKFSISVKSIKFDFIEYVQDVK